MANQNIERMDAVVIEIEGKLESLSPLSSECSIYRVPKRIREINSKVYTPQVVSIGPFHHGKEHLRVMEEHKLRYLKSFLNRTELGLKDYFEVGKKWEDKARHCYAETIELNSNNFVKMMLVDGSFIVECLLRFQFPQLIDESDRLFKKPWMVTSVGKDMILLENQLPFFVLESLFDLVSLHIPEEIPSFLKLFNGFFFLCGIVTELPLRVFNPVSNPRIQHFVDFIRFSYLESFPQEWCPDNEYCCPPSVTQLHEAGTMFKTRTSCSLFDINFTNRILEIPQLEINGNTEMLFQNIIAFEDSHCKDKYIIQYMFQLRDMIKTSKDLGLLFHNRIITGLTGRKEILRMFENTTKFYAGECFYFTDLSRSLNAYCTAPGNRWKATLKRDYYNTIFNTPWKILSVILALVILLLTTIQAVCSLISLEVSRGLFKCFASISYIFDVGLLL